MEKRNNGLIYWKVIPYMGLILASNSILLAYLAPIIFIKATGCLKALGFKLMTSSTEHPSDFLLIFVI